MPRTLPSAVGDTPAADCGEAARRWTLIAAILGSGMAFVDGTIVNVALPAIQHVMQANTAGAQWVMESYALLLSALLLVGGVLGDRFGRRRVFALGALVFTVSSLGCAASPGIGWLVAARGVQGIGAALLVPGSLALITSAYPKERRGRAIGTWSAFSGVTAAIGPVLGGFLVEHLSWHWAFLINLPLGLALIAICRWQVPESRGDGTGRVDMAGALLATLALSGVVYALIEAPQRGWLSTGVCIAAAVGVSASIAFVVVERRIDAPMLPLGLFRDRNFAGANLLTLLLYAALGGSLFFVPLDLIQVQGYGATGAGASLLPFIVIMFVLSRWTGQLVDRVGARLPLVVGVAGLVAIAVFGVVLTQGFDERLRAGLSEVSLPRATVQGILDQKARLAGIELPRGAEAAKAVVDHAFVAGFRHVMLWSATLALPSSLAAGVMIRDSRRRGRKLQFPITDVKRP